MEFDTAEEGERRAGERRRAGAEEAEHAAGEQIAVGKTVDGDRVTRARISF